MNEEKRLIKKEKKLINFLGGYGFKWLRNEAGLFPGGKDCIVAFTKAKELDDTLKKNMNFISDKVKEFGMERVGDVFYTKNILGDDYVYGVIMAFKEVE